MTSSTSLEKFHIENAIVSSVNKLQATRLEFPQVQFVDRLNLDYHVSQISKKASKKLHTLSRVSIKMNINK